MIVTAVSIDEQRQRSEKPMAEKPVTE